MPRDRTPQDGFSDSDQQWFDRMTGKPGPYDDDRAVREADALKQALELECDRLAREAGVAAREDEALEHEWQRLQFALKREGLLRERRRPRWMWPALGGLAAAVLIAAGLLPVWRDVVAPTYDPPPVLRGAPRLGQVAVPDPRKAAERFANALRDAGLRPGLYQKEESFVVDINLLPGQMEMARPAFAQINEAPAVGMNRVTFAAR
ncbi:MAG: hypothetical protein JNL30_00280 [Rubrivivax sp.]|nr:hypothetical protein [Rubrivivax sp.]